MSFEESEETYRNRFLKARSQLADIRWRFEGARQERNAAFSAASVLVSQFIVGVSVVWIGCPQMEFPVANLPRYLEPSLGEALLWSTLVGLSSYVMIALAPVLFYAVSECLEKQRYLEFFRPDYAEAKRDFKQARKEFNQSMKQKKEVK